MTRHRKLKVRRTVNDEWHWVYVAGNGKVLDGCYPVTYVDQAYCIAQARRRDPAATVIVENGTKGETR